MKQELLMSDEERAQLKEAKQLAREQGLSMTQTRGAGMWLHYQVGDHVEIHFPGYLPEVLRWLRARKGREQREQALLNPDAPSPRSRPAAKRRGAG